MQSRLPQVDKLLRDAGMEPVLAESRREIVLKVLRSFLDELRLAGQCPEPAEIISTLQKRLLQLASPSLQKVINGTGVVLNTNLGRAPIAAAHLHNLLDVAAGYCNLEINLETGKRGKRSSRLEKLLNVLSGAEASLAVNNNAAAVVLAVNCFALNREVIVSRGELIEIGGSFRLPDVIEAAGGKLREVGTTNKTRLADYERAIGPDTGLVMRCHRSNFEIRGFTEETGLQELAKLCRQKNIPLVEDLGSGVLLELSECGLDDEPTLEESLSTGCDLVTFSGDKLLGGPQAGIIAGRKDLVERLAKHPLYRALRLDKISISLLEQALCSYVSSHARRDLPALNLLSASEAELAERVSLFCQKAEPLLRRLSLEMVATESAIGGGSLPGKVKASKGIRLRAPLKANQLAQMMRELQPPVIVLTKDDDCIIDFRTVLLTDEALLLNALMQLEQTLN